MQRDAAGGSQRQREAARGSGRLLPLPAAAGSPGAKAAPDPDQLPWRAGAHARLRATAVPQGPVEPADAAQPATSKVNCAHRRPARLSLAQLLKRMIKLFLEHCPDCGGELKIIAAILETPVIERILTHVAVQIRAPPRAPARGQALLHAA